MYKLMNLFNGSQVVIRLSDNACIPMNEANSDYQAFLKFLADGGQPLPADEVKSA